MPFFRYLASIPDYLPSIGFQVPLQLYFYDTKVQHYHCGSRMLRRKFSPFLQKITRGTVAIRDPLPYRCPDNTKGQKLKT